MRNVTPEFINQKNKLVVTPIYLYSIQYDEDGDNWLRLTSWPTQVTFDGVVYTPYNIAHNTIRENLEGVVDRVGMAISNVDRTLQAYLEQYDGLRDCTVTIQTVWEEELSEADCYISETFRVEDSASNQNEVILTLSASLDVLEVSLPRRTFFRGHCLFQFKGTECGYSGGESECNKTFQRCEELGNVGRFGGFPGIPMKRLLID